MLRNASETRECKLFFCEVGRFSSRSTIVVWGTTRWSSAPREQCPPNLWNGSTNVHLISRGFTDSPTCSLTFLKQFLEGGPSQVLYNVHNIVVPPGALTPSDLLASIPPTTCLILVQTWWKQTYKQSQNEYEYPPRTEGKCWGECKCMCWWFGELNWCTERKYSSQWFSECNWCLEHKDWWCWAQR